ncbi:hypothetical protein NHQ30_004309 [Ciborinia camelliae]|nr:hypothetical protein NHQ30_004309 [Ciborinia camelliae]
MPRTRSRQARISRRSSPLDAQVGHGIRPSLKKTDLCVGCIMWLPAKIESDESLTCSRGQSCCNGKKLDDDGYNHPVVILCYQGTTCYIAMITSKTRSNISNRIPISQIPPVPNVTDSEFKLYLESGEMNKQSYVIIEHIFPIPLAMLRSISFKSDSRAFDTRLRKQSHADLVSKFEMSDERTIFVDTSTMRAQETNAETRVPRVTFTDPWQEIRGNTSATATHHTREMQRHAQDRRRYSEPTPPTTTPALPSTRVPRAQTTFPASPAREWYTYHRATDREVFRGLATERQALLQHQPPPLSSVHQILPIQSTWQQQQTSIHSNYHAALPSVERYDRSYWDARIHNTNTRAHDLERGRNGGEEEEGDCDGRLFAQLVVVFLSLGGLVWWIYRK